MKHILLCSCRAMGLGALALATSIGCAPEGSDYGPCVPAALPARAVLVPRAIHTGFNDRDVFQVPIVTNFAPDAWETEDAAIALVDPVGECKSSTLQEVTGLLTTTGAGSTRVSALAGGMRLSVDVVVSEYTSEQIDLGSQRYHSPANASESRVACASCHQGPEGVDHSPLAIAFFSDATILQVITQGRYPDCLDATGDPCQCGSSPECDALTSTELSLAHAWNLSEAEAAAIVPYLRSLPPRGL